MNLGYCFTWHHFWNKQSTRCFFARHLWHSGRNMSSLNWAGLLPCFDLLQQLRLASFASPNSPTIIVVGYSQNKQQQKGYVITVAGSLAWQANSTVKHSTTLFSVRHHWYQPSYYGFEMLVKHCLLFVTGPRPDLQAEETATASKIQHGKRLLFVAWRASLGLSGYNW